MSKDFARACSTSSWPGLSRPSTPSPEQHCSKAWMPGTRPGMTDSSRLRLRGGALVLPVVDEVVDHGRIGERRGVAQRAVIVLGDLAQDAAHDLAGARFRQARRELDEVGRG